MLYKNFKQKKTTANIQPQIVTHCVHKLNLFSTCEYYAYHYSAFKNRDKNNFWLCTLKTVTV